MKKTGVLVLAASLFAVGLISPSAGQAQPCTDYGMGQNCGMVNCMTTGSTKNCTRTALVVGSVNMVVVLMASNANCSGFPNGGSATLKAMAMTGEPTPRTCSFSITNTNTAATCTCSITSADGLPVELLEFSVEDEAEEEIEDDV